VTSFSSTGDVVSPRQDGLPLRLVKAMETKLKLNLIFFALEFNITRIIQELRTLLKFNIFFLPVMIAAYAAANYVVSKQFSAAAEQEVLDTARLMLETAAAMRAYTTTQIAPLLEQEQTRVEQGAQNMQKVLDVEMPAALRKAMAGLPMAREHRILQTTREQLASGSVQPQQNGEPELQFFPQSIPFYAATEAFNYFRNKYPGYSYKEAALNPTNPRDRTTDWEADIVNSFRDNPSKREFAGHRDSSVGSSLFLSTPIRADSESCLACHGPAEKAPPEIVKLYGAGNGFGWKLGDVVGAQILSIPDDVASNRATAAMKTVLIWLAGVFGGLYLIVNAIVFVFISKLVPARAPQ